MTTVSRFSRQNDVGLRAHNVALWENAVLVVALVPESKALCYWHRAGILRRIMLRTAGFIMHIFATCFQAITVQSNCYANFALIKGQCEAWEVSFFRVHFQATVIRTCSLCRMKKKNLRLQPIKRRVSLAWKPNWLPYHHVLKLWLTGLTPGQALDQLCHRIQTSKKIFCQRKTLTCSTQQ